MKLEAKNKAKSLIQSISLIYVCNMLWSSSSSLSLWASQLTIWLTISTRLTWSRNSWNSFHDSTFINLFVIILLIETCSTVIHSSLIFWHSQWLWIFTCWSLIYKQAIFSVTRWIVWQLSQWIWICWSFILTFNSFSRCLIYWSSLTSWDSESSFTSVVDVVIIFCLFICHLITSSNKIMT